MPGYVPEGESIVEDGRKMRNKAGKNGSWLPLVQVEKVAGLQATRCVRF